MEGKNHLGLSVLGSYSTPPPPNSKYTPIQYPYILEREYVLFGVGGGGGQVITGIVC